MSISLSSGSSQQTYSVGVHLGIQIQTWLQTQADCSAITLALSGELGAGKTTFAQGVAFGLGVTVPVTSPTFTLVNEYSLFGPEIRPPWVLYHVDAYRLEEDAESEATTFGLEEIFDSPCAVFIVEWAERLQTLLPSDRLLIYLNYVDESAGPRADATDHRQLTLEATGSSSRAILSLLDEKEAMDKAR